MRHKRPLAITLALAPAPASANIKIAYDYTCDTSHFFGAPRKNIPEAAASVCESRITDDLGALVASGGNRFDLNLGNSGGSTGSITRHEQTIAPQSLSRTRSACNRQEVAHPHLASVGRPSGRQATFEEL